MDEDYKQSDISKEVERLMDEEGYEFGEAVKEAMSRGYKNGGLMVAIQKFNQGGNVIDSRATAEDFANALKSVSAGSTYQQQADAQKYARQQANQMLRDAMKSADPNKGPGLQGIYDTFFKNKNTGIGPSTFTPGASGRMMSYSSQDRDRILDAMSNQMLDTTNYSQSKVNERREKEYADFMNNLIESTYGKADDYKAEAATLNMPTEAYFDYLVTSDPKDTLSTRDVLSRDPYFDPKTYVARDPNEAQQLSPLNIYYQEELQRQIDAGIPESERIQKGQVMGMPGAIPTGGTSPSPYESYADALARTKKQMGLREGGMAGNKTYHQYHDQYVPRDEESMGYANGGGIGSMMIPKRGLVNAPGGYAGEGEEILTVQDIFERDTPLTENLFGLSEGFTLSPITMLRRYMAEKELEKEKEEMDSELPMDFAQGGRVGLFMGGSPLTGEALNIYTSMNAYGYTDQEIADRLSGLGLYTPNSGTTTPPTTPPTTPTSGGGGGGEGGGGGGDSIFDIKNKKTRDTKIDKGIFDAEADKGSLTLEEITAMNDLSGQESMRGQSQIPTKTTSTLEEIISSDRPYNMRDIAGEELVVNEDLIDRGNPTNDSRIVSEELGITGVGKPNIKDIAGAVNENFIDRGNPTGDSRIVSEEQGLVGTPLTLAEARRAMTQPGLTDKATVYDPMGIKLEDGRFSYDMNKTSVDDFKKGPSITDRNRGQITSTPKGGITTIDRPNMADIAGPIGFKGAPITTEDLQTIDGEPIGFTGTLPAPPDIFSGYAQNPEGVEDPFDGKYTPSFEEKKEAEGILAGLVDKALNFSLSDIAKMGQNAITKKALNVLGFSDPFAYLGTMGINKFKNIQVQKEIKKQAASAKTRKETREIQDRIDKEENNINKTASKNDSKSGSSIVNPNSKYGKEKGYTGGNPNPHTSTGWSGSSKSNKSSSNKSSSNKSSGGGGGGKGGGADMGSSNKGGVSTGAGNNPWGR